MPVLFDELERAAWGGFIVTQSKVFAAIELDLRKRFGVTHTEFEVLLRLSFAPGGKKRILELAEQSLLSRSGTSRAVERLVRAGHVEREGASEDGRGAYAVLTARGREHFMKAAAEHVALVRREFLGHFTRSELKTLAAAWDRVNGGRAPKPKRRAARARNG
ncbi:MAG: MarR family transcriptional regulator [Myxococcaceae bacterium]